MVAGSNQVLPDANFLRVIFAPPQNPMGSDYSDVRREFLCDWPAALRSGLFLLTTANS